MERVGFWRRALAAGLDLLIGVPVIGAATVAVAILLALADISDALTERLAGLTANVLVLAYTSTEVWFAGTPGKLLSGIQVGTSAGTAAGKWTLALRWSSKFFAYFIGLLHAITLDPATYFLSGWMNTVVVVGCLQALDEHRRAWHDEWAGTAVYRSADLSRVSGPTTPPPLPPPGAVHGSGI